MRLKEYDGIQYLTFWKNKKTVYVHVFCFNDHRSGRAFCITMRIYAKYRRTLPDRPGYRNWIHSIPVSNLVIPDHEILLIHQIAFFIYNAISVVVGPEGIPSDDEERDSPLPVNPN